MDYTAVQFSSNLIYTKWCAQTFPPIFGLFAIFDRNLAKIVAPDPSEKPALTPLISANKRQRNACSNYVPLISTALRLRSVTDKKHSDKDHIFARTAGARCIIYPFINNHDDERTMHSEKHAEYIKQTRKTNNN